MLVRSSSQYLAVGFDNGTLRIYSVNRWQIISKIQKHEKEIWDARFTKREDFLITCSSDNTIRFWSVVNGNLIFKIQETSDVYGFSLQMRNKLLITATTKFVHMWKLDTWEIPKMFKSLLNIALVSDSTINLLESSSSKNEKSEKNELDSSENAENLDFLFDVKITYAALSIEEKEKQEKEVNEILDKILQREQKERDRKKSELQVDD